MHRQHRDGIHSHAIPSMARPMMISGSSIERLWPSAVEKTSCGPGYRTSTQKTREVDGCGRAMPTSKCLLLGGVDSEAASEACWNGSM